MTPAPDSTPITRSRRTLRSVFGSLCFAAILVGCGSSDSKPGGSGANVILKNENNYSSTSTLTLTSVDTASGVDIDICWTGMTKDLQCHDVVPTTGVKNISLVQFINKTPAQAQVELISGDLDTSVVVYRDFHTTGDSTCTKLSKVQGLGGGAPIALAQDYVESSSDTYVVIASNTTTVGAGAQSMIIVTPKAGNSNTAVDIPSGCDKLDFNANLQDLTKVSIPAQGPWVVDWSQVTEDSEGKDPNFIVRTVDLILAHYDKPIADIEADFFNIETSATHLWRIRNIEGTSSTSKNLAQAQDADGNLFTGFEPAGGVWALGLQCPSCQNPAPLFLTILEPSGA